MHMCEDSGGRGSSGELIVVWLPTCLDVLRDLVEEVKGIVDAILVYLLATLDECVNHVAHEAQHVERLRAEDSHQLSRVRPVDLLH